MFTKLREFPENSPGLVNEDFGVIEVKDALEKSLVLFLKISFQKGIKFF